MALPNKHTELVVVSYHLRGLQTLDHLFGLAGMFDVMMNCMIPCYSNLIMYIHSIHCKVSGYQSVIWLYSGRGSIRNLYDWGI